MTNPKIRIHDLETDKIIDREMTDVEFDAYKAQKAIDLAEAKVLADNEAAKETAKAKLAALGLTVDDLKALGL